MICWDYAVDVETFLKAIDTDLLPYNEKEWLFVKSLNLPFYLTGGTALSRGYCTSFWHYKNNSRILSNR